MDRNTLRATLRERFGFSEFRRGQEQIVTAILSGRDALAIMPTGGGKSICYQLPAVMMEGITLVISPLISLMTDQVMALKAHGVPAAYVNSTLNFSQIRKVYQYIREGRYKIIYVAPERLESEEFIDTVCDLPISLVAVDEAHCISQWGNDFRPSYLRISDFVSALASRPPLAAFTATATEQVRRDITEKLKLRAPEVAVTGFERPNLRFEVREPTDKTAELKKILRERRGKSGIIYCMTRSAVESVCELLIKEGYPATRYHAGLDEAERKANQEDFIYDRKPIMVATNAFGMGIDKPDVSFVLHFNMPLTMEGYYQEAGRAGRDGSEADCILLFSPRDIITARLLVEGSEPAEELSEDEVRLLKKRDYERLNRMINYCKSTSCLVGQLLSYFGEAREGGCGRCGNCNATFERKDVTREAQEVIFAIIELKRKKGYTFGPTVTAALLQGSKSTVIRENGLSGFSSYGKLSHMKGGDIKDLLSYLEEAGYITKANDFGSLELTDTSADLLTEGAALTRSVRHIEVKKPSRKKSREAARLPRGLKGGAPITENEREVFSALSNLRWAISAEKKVPPYVVFSNATLQDMARKMPTTREEFLEVSGVGETKARQYADRFIALIKDFM